VSSRKRVVVRSHHAGFMALLVLVLIAVVAFAFLAVSEVAFERIGFTPLDYVLILIATLVGSVVNIPLWSSTKLVTVPTVREVEAFWVTYRIPVYEEREVSTVVAINVGGALIPITVSAYLLAAHAYLLPQVVLAVAVTAALVHLIAKTVKGVGVVTPAFLPPIFAALTALVFVSSGTSIVAYIAGTVGTVVGADLLNLRKVYQSGAATVSIGGAGTFDGVFLTGILAAFLV
jgi:uncharacterized membrane protein